MVVKQIARFLLSGLLLWAQTLVAGPVIESWKTETGAKVLFVHAPAIDMLDIRVVFDAGSARDGKIPGIASLTSTLLNDGAGEWDADSLAERFEDIGAQFVTTALRDMSVVAVRTLIDPEVLESTLQTFERVLNQPAFESDEIERRRDQTRIALEQQKESPSDTASKAFFKHLYGDHPYAHNSMGTPESIAAVSREDIEQFHQRYFVAKNAVIAMVGAIDREHAEKIANRLTANMPAGEKAPELPEVQPLEKGKTLQIEFPSSQTHLAIGHPVMARQDKDYFPLYVGNHMLGGSGLVSMLGDEIREKRGLAYSVYSYFMPMRGQGPYLMGAQTRNDRAQESQDVILQTLRDFRDKGPTEERVISSKKNITGGFPLRVASNSNIVEYIAMMGFYDYPLDYLDTFVDKVKAVTAEQIQDAFNRRVNPDNFVIVRVGKTIEDKATEKTQKPVE